MSTDTVSYVPSWKCKACGPEISMLAVELVKALRLHPNYEGGSMKDLLAIVRASSDGKHELLIKLSKKLVPTFCAVLKNEGIGVRVSTLTA